MSIGEGDRRALSSVELYDFVDESWAHLPPLQTARRNVAVVALEGILYAMGGIDQNNKDLASVERFNFDACRWENAASLSHCRGEKATGSFITVSYRFVRKNLISKGDGLANRGHFEK